MSDIIAIFGILFITALAFPALLTAVWLVFPAAVDRAQQRIEMTPRRCALMGLFALLGAGTVVAILLSSAAAPFQALGFGLTVLILAQSTIGAAGLVMRLSQRLNEQRNHPMSPLAGFLAAAVVLELAVAFPLIGWLLALPTALLTALGATVFALLRWRPRTRPQPGPALSPTAVSR